jgi:hypothetical protein
MDEVRLSGCALLAAVMERREKIRSPDQIDICIRAICLYFFDDIFNADHRSTTVILQSKAFSPLRFFPTVRCGKQK